MTTWFTADWHLGHQRIIELSGRPFDDVNHMNREIIDRHNAVVRADDHVWVLGDVALGPIRESLALVQEFAGHLHLVLGNHDRPFDALRKGRSDQALRWTETYLAAGFESVESAGPGLVTCLPGLGDVLLSHFPYRGDSHDEDRFVEQRPVDTGLPLLHGHVHERWTMRDRMLNVGVDVHSFAPVSETQAIRTLLACRCSSHSAP